VRQAWPLLSEARDTATKRTHKSERGFHIPIGAVVLVAASLISW
jgi:hypothetical protein